MSGGSQDEEGDATDEGDASRDPLPKKVVSKKRMKRHIVWFAASPMPMAKIRMLSMLPSPHVESRLFLFVMKPVWLLTTKQPMRRRSNAPFALCDIRIQIRIDIAIPLP
jgi:hypothetical protein